MVAAMPNRRLPPEPLSPIAAGEVVGADPHEAVLTLLAARAPEATICPSEVARAIIATDKGDPAAAHWRDAMPAVHAAIDHLVDQGLVRLSWKGKALTARSGPYRIGRGKGR